jgi:acyl dehydratase
MIKAKELPALVGKQMKPSSWLEITQERVNHFADCTNDHQYIHTDREKAAKTPFRGTIAHGYLTLSLLSFLTTENALEVEGTVMAINYGSDKVRFLNPERVGSRIRAQQVLREAIEKNRGQWLLKNEVTVEIENQEKPAMIAETLVMLIIR